MSSKRIAYLEQLVEEKDYVGAVIQQDYESMLIATVDYRQMMVGGVPKNCFLTVSVPDQNDKVGEVILLSVEGPTPMQTQRELLMVREELAAQQVAGSVSIDLDTQTETRLSTQSLRCKIVGSFYLNEEGEIRFGADVDNIRSASVLRVYRPTGKALSLIASFSNYSGDSSALLEVGKVRYTETRKVIDTEASAYINVEDFIGKKTALFGATRGGKSNSVKILLQKIHQYSHLSSVARPVAQLVFDPQGEYANANSQDGEALANIGDESEVSIYKIMEKSSNPKEKFLQFNLFLEENLELTYNLILSEIRNGISADANYIAPLFNVDFAPLGENATLQEKIHANRKKLAFFALMFEGIKRHPVPRFSVNIGEDLISKVTEDSELSISQYNANEVVIDSTSAASKVAKLLMKASQEGGLSESWRNEFEEGDAGVFFDQLVQIQEKGRNGVKASISHIEKLHSSEAEGDIRENVWQDIQLGKLIIIDLSRGSTQTSQVLSELIVNYLLDVSSDRFVNGKEPIPFQIVVEEAHNLFERDSKKTDRDPWVRISKEASKYHIGLVYATQEVSSVDKRILSNTSNFIISALTSIKETNELANYFQFADWSDHIRRIETKGFVRLKTMSSPYIVPVQIEKFEALVSSSVKSKTSDSKTAASGGSKKSAPQESSNKFEELEF